MARPPGGTRLLIAMFSPWVALAVNTTCSGDGTPKVSAASVRVRNSSSSAALALAYPPRPGELMVCMARSMAARTPGGL